MVIDLACFWECVFSVEFSVLLFSFDAMRSDLRGHIYTQDIRKTFFLLFVFPSKVASSPMDPIDTKEETLH